VRENERQLARENQAKYEKAQAHKNMIVSQYNSTMSAKEYQRVRFGKLAKDELFLKGERSIRERQSKILC